jgi:hypothetical protein
VLKDATSVRIDERDLEGRKQVWIACEGQTLTITFGPREIGVIGWVDRPIRRKTFKLENYNNGNEGR